MPHSVAVESRRNIPLGDFMSWVVCLSAGLFFLYEFFQLNVFDVINQPLREEFHISATQLSWMSSAYLWANILFLLPAGIILDKYSIRKVIIVSMLLCIVGTIGFALTHSFWLASVFHFLSGIGNAFCFLSCVVLVAHWFPSHKQALVIGSVVTMAFIGGMMAHTPFAYLYDILGWRKALLVDGAIGIALLLWIYCTVQDRPENASSTVHNAKKGMLPGLMSILFKRQNWLAGLYTSLMNLPIMVLCALWGSSYLQVVHHLSDIAASNIISLIFMGSIVGCPLVGWLSDIHGRRKPLMIFGAAATFLTVIPLFMPVSLSVGMLNILFISLGFFTSTQVISYPLVGESNKAEYTGTATGIASVIIMGGGGIGQILFGWLMSYHANNPSTQYSVSDFQFAMWMFPIAAVAALIFVLLMRETYCKRIEG